MERTPEGNDGELTAAMATLSFGRFDVPTVLIKSPEEMYRAPDAKQWNLVALHRSLLLKGRVDEQADFVLFVGATRLCLRSPGSSRL